MGEGKAPAGPAGGTDAGTRGSADASARRLVAIAALVFSLLVPAAALGAFGDGTPGESPRINTPDDPEFDDCELDDEEGGIADCTSYAEEQYGLFGFSPDSANEIPGPHSLAATSYDDCSQLDQQGRDVNTDLGDPECAQISGIRADSAWKYSTGDPEVVVAILDTGIRWQQTELTNKIHLNAGELPVPQEAGGTPCAEDDCNGDGSFDVRDFADDPRVEIDAGDDEADAMLDGSDLIATFSTGSFPGIEGGADDDGNGFVDDIAGWDFFDDDNDPFDASSCCSANGHGTGRAVEAAAETDNAEGGAGICPACQIMPLRIWDTFVTPTDNYAAGALYATENGASVIEGAVGGLTNTRFAREVFEFADTQGVALMLVSSDINSANHNYPTNYNEAIYVGGSIYDTAPNETCTGPGGLPLIGDVIPPPPEEIEDGCEQLLGLLDENLGIGSAFVGQPITTSFFRNSNLTQYGGKADIVLMGSTGSENTGQSSGAAGLLASFAREQFGEDNPLSGNEIRQLLTMTAEDVLPDNTGIIGQPDKANPGWDPHFGYGRVNLAAAMERIADDRVPPEVQIDSPDWFAPLNVDRVPASGVVIRGHAAAPHSASGVGEWEVEYACGADALDADFVPIPGTSSGSGEVDGPIATLPKSLLADLAENCNGEVTGDAGRPAGAPTDGAWPADPYPDPDPERHSFQIRFTVHEAGDPDNFGRYRKTLFAYEDDGNLDGWPRPIGSGSDAANYETGSGGETSTRLYDLDGDNELEVLLATSSGELHALRADGTPLPSFNGGQPVRTDPYALADAHPPPAAIATGKARESLRIPAIGDIDGDREAEIVATAGEHVYAWEADGTRTPGFPVGVDRSRSEPCVAGVPKPCFHPADRAITGDNHIKRGIFGSPALADLDLDGRLDIVTGSMDQHVYAWDGEGDPMPGFPAKVASDGADGAEIVNSPAIAQLDGTGPPEIVIATNEVIPGDPALPTSPFDVIGSFLGSATGSNPVYALHGDGSPVDGWPARVGVAAGDLLPMVLPGHDAAIIDVDGDGDDEVSVSAGTSIATGGGVKLVDGDASTVRSYQSEPAQSPDQGPILNLADYSSIGDITGAGPSVIKGGLTLNGAANLLAVNQNLPFSHVVQAWDPATGASTPGFPRATDDFQLVSQPAVARVGGSGPGRQAIYGTGLYQLHAYGTGGIEPAGWPKFTGGWTQATPSMGDVDGDGDLEVSALTREGWSFLWSTGADGGPGVDACDDSNEEWWTFHHDEFGTANYGTDARPPGTPENLAVSRLPSGGVELTWKAPGDDWLCGEAEAFEIRVSGEPIDSPGDGEEVATPPTASQARAAGESETVRIGPDEFGDARHAAVLYRDEAGNWGRLAAVSLPAPLGKCEARLTGTDGNDRIAGSSLAETIRGRGGNDRLRGGPGDDCMGGNGGNDRVKGGGGDDRVKGQGGKDRLRGGGGADRISGNRDDDRVAGGGGGDTLRGGEGRDKVSGGGGDDKVNVRGGGRDKVSCGRGKDSVKAGRRDRVRKDCEQVELK